LKVKALALVMLVHTKLEGLGLLIPSTHLKLLVIFAMDEMGIKIC
jgi:hypothetical protein